METDNGGLLYIVPVPIGNRGDMTPRALEVLRSVDLIACENVQKTRKLFQLYAIPMGRCVAYHQQNESQQVRRLLQWLQQGKTIALVSEAGTPLLSDPGFVLVRKAIEQGIPIVPLPGPTAFVPALVASGLPPVPFAFVGFPPRKKGRKRFLQWMLQLPMTVVCYEAPHRIQKLLEEFMALGAAQRQLCLARELTKRYEEFLRGTPPELLAILQQRHPIRGEFVVVLEGQSR